MNSNPTQPTTPLSINGVAYKLLFDFEAIANAEDLIGRPLLMGLSKRDIDRPTISLVRAMLYTGLHTCQPDLTYAQAQSLVDRKNIAHVWGKILVAWAESIPDGDKDAAATDPLKGQN